MASLQDVARDLAASLLADPRHDVVTVWKCGQGDYGSTVNGGLPPAGATVLTERIDVSDQEVALDPVRAEDYAAELADWLHELPWP